MGKSVRVCFEKDDNPSTAGTLDEMNSSKANILARKCQIMQFSFEYINKTPKLNQQTHSEANGKQVRLFEKKSTSIFSHHHSPLYYLLLYH